MNLSELKIGARVQTGFFSAPVEETLSSPAREYNNNANTYGWCGRLELLGVSGERARVKTLTVYRCSSSTANGATALYLRLLKRVNAAWVIVAQSENAEIFNNYTIAGDPIVFNMVSVDGVEPPTPEEVVAVVAVSDPNAEAYSSVSFGAKTDSLNAYDAGGLSVPLTENASSFTLFNFSPVIDICYDSLYTKTEPVFWRVISNDRERFGGVLLLQEKIHTARTFDTGNENSWEESDLRDWVKSTWESCFSAFLKKQITPQIGDNFFLLSQDEISLLPSDIYNAAPEKSEIYSLTVTESGAQSLSGFSLRTPIAECVAFVDYSTGSPRVIAAPAALSYHLPRLACVLASRLFVRWVSDENGSYYKIAHKPVAAEPVFPEDLTRNTDFTVSWNFSLLEADLKEFVLERRDDGGEWVEIYRGTEQELAQNSGAGRTIQFRLKLEDSEGAISDWTESRIQQLNTAPVITALGIYSDPEAAPTTALAETGARDMAMVTEGVEYVVFSIADDIVNDVQVTFSLYNLICRKYEVVSTQTVSCSPDSTNVYCKLPIVNVLNGNNRLKVEAKDTDGGVSSLTYHFVRVGSDIKFQSLPIGEGLDKMPVAARISVDGNFRDFVDIAGFTFAIEACNNLLDESPTWQDITENVLNETNIVFANTAKTAEKWLVGIKLSIYNPTSTTLYINSISGSTATA